MSQCRFLPPYQATSWCPVSSSLSTHFARADEWVTYTVETVRTLYPSVPAVGGICFPQYFSCPGSVQCIVNGYAATVAGGNGVWSTPTAVSNQFFDTNDMSHNTFTFTVQFKLGPTYTACFAQNGTGGAMVGCYNTGWGWEDYQPLNIAASGRMEREQARRDRLRGGLGGGGGAGGGGGGGGQSSGDPCKKKNVGMPDEASTVVDAGAAELSYTMSSSADVPASLGWGWTMRGANLSVVEDVTTQDLVFYDGSGSFERFKKVGTNSYQPLYPDNYSTLTVSGGLVTITLKNKVQLNFRSDGKISTRVDRNGNTTTYSYDGSARLSSISDGEGRVVYLDYGTRTDGQPVSMREQNATTGRLTSYQYNANGRLWKITDPENNVWEFLYNSNGLLEKKINPRGVIETQWTYANGVVASETHMQERKLSYSYAAGANDTTVITVTEEDLTLNPDPSPRVSTLTYNKFRNLVHQVDPLGNQWSYEYQDFLNPYLLTRVVDPNGNETVYDFDDKANLTSVTDAQGNTTSMTYVQDYLLSEIHPPAVTVNGSLVTYQPTVMGYDTNGNLTSITNTLNANSLVTSFAIRSDGRVSSITNRLNQVTSFEYTTQSSGVNAGNLKKIIMPSGPNGAPAREVVFTYDQYDNVTKVTDPGGNEVNYQFDGLDRLTQVVNPLLKQVNYHYDHDVLDYIDLPANQASSGAARRTRFTRDAAGRVLQILSKISSTTEQMRVRHEYDGRSNLKKLARLQNSVEKSWNFGFDVLNRQNLVLDPLSRESSVEYSPYCREYTVTSARGMVTTYSRDSLCRLTEVLTPDENRQYSYDELGRLVSVSVTKNPNARYYDSTSSELPARFGQARFASTPVTETTTYLYDELSRVTQISLPGSKTLLYEYDAEGQLTKQTDVHGRVTEYSYYNDGRLYQVTVKRSGQSDRVFTYSYDAAGRMSQIVYPSSTGIIAKFSDSSGNSGWDANGNLRHLRYVQGTTHVQSFAYSYDDSGNRTQMVDTPANTANAVTWDYGYDWLNRLTSVKKNNVLTRVYSYDESDNRLSIQWPVTGDLQQYVYDAADQLSQRKLNSSTVETFQHDADGNMIARTLTATNATTRYDWNGSNQLTKITLPSTATHVYEYDAEGVRKKADGNTEFFSSGSMSIADTRPSGNVSFIQGHMLLGLDVAGTFGYFLADALGTVRVVVNGSGTIVATYAPDEFGRQESASGSTDMLGHTFQGALGVRNDWDASGLYYARARYYDAGLGRWLSADPIGFAGGLNAYVAMGNNPATFVDPSGKVKMRLEPIEIKLKSRDFCGKHSGQVFAVVTFVPIYDTMTGTITLEDFSVDQKAPGILVGLGEIHVESIRLLSPPDNPRGMGVPTSIPQNPTVFAFSGAGGGDIPTLLSQPVVNTDMRRAIVKSGVWQGQKGSATYWF